MKKRIGIWIRVSTEDQAKGDSPEHHEHRARSYAELKAWDVIEIYHLEAVSGKSVIHHPEAQRMIKDIKSGHITGLIFSKLARLARNTRELLEFADIFQKYNADLTSLDESIDTSTPVGRFFYTLIAAMAEWERGEIASRVKASVDVRAKLGKSLGGKAPYGYKWVNKELEIDEKEVPIRKLVHELFVQHKRKKTVATTLNEKGYRTRNGSKFSDTSIDRMLRDPIAKGLRRINYTQSKGENKQWKYKPKEEWVFIPAPRIISDELWDQCARILDDMAKKKGKVRRKGVHLFSGIVKCECGSKMYMRTLSPKYVCTNCKNKIAPNDLEEIFHKQLKNFLFSDSEIQNHLDLEQKKVVDKEKLLESTKKDHLSYKKKIKDIFELYHARKLTKSAFSDEYDPIYAKQKQLERTIMELQAEIDALKMLSLGNSQVLHDAQNLHKQWHKFTTSEKKAIIETITEKIIVGSEDIEIYLTYIPTLVSDTDPHPLNKTLQLSNAGMPLWLLQSPGQRMCLWTGSCKKIPQQNIRTSYG